MIRTILIDDEESALSTLSKKIELYCEDIEIVATCKSPKEGLSKIHALKPELVFLDIEMPWMNGFEMLDCLGDNIDFQVVFVTAYDQYAIQAFKVQALDYLLKPVDKDDLIDCIDRVQRSSKKFEKKDLDTLKINLEKPVNSNRLMLHSSQGIEVLALLEIMYCQASSNYTYVFTTDDRKVVVSKTLSEIDRSLRPKYFLRVHKSFTVNLNHVKRFTNLDGGELILQNGTSIPVSRRKKGEVLQALSELE